MNASSANRTNSRVISRRNLKFIWWRRIRIRSNLERRRPPTSRASTSLQMIRLPSTFLTIKQTKKKRTYLRTKIFPKIYSIRWYDFVFVSFFQNKSNRNRSGLRRYVGQRATDDPTIVRHQSARRTVSHVNSHQKSSRGGRRQRFVEHYRELRRGGRIGNVGPFSVQRKFISGTFLIFYCPPFLRNKNIFFALFVN